MKYYVYIMSSRMGRVLYIGVTGDLQERVLAHKSGMGSKFTAKYNVDRLVWCEAFPDAHNAISVEKKLKGCRRSKKVWLIEKMNPGWVDLASDW